MESSDEETDSGALGPAYSLTDMLDELGSESTSGVTSPVPSEDLNSPTHKPEKDITTNKNTTTITNDGSTIAQVPEGNTDPITGSKGQPEVRGTINGVPSGNIETSEKATPSENQNSPKENDQKGTSPGKPDPETDSNKQVGKESEQSTEAVKTEEKVLKEENRDLANKKESDTFKCESTKEKTDTMKLEQKDKCITSESTKIDNGVSTKHDNGLITQSEKIDNEKQDTEKEVVNKNMGEKQQSEENSEDDVNTKDDPVWKRKKVIKRKRPGRSLNSQSSTGSGESESSTSSIGSANGFYINALDGKALTPDREIPSKACDKITEVQNEQAQSPNKVNGNIKDSNTCLGKEVENSKTGTGSGLNPPENAKVDTQNSKIVNGRDKKGNQSIYSNIDEFQGYEPYDFKTPPRTDPNEGDIFANVPDSAIYENISSRSDPRRSTLRRGATLKGLSQEDLVSMTYQGSQKVIKVLPDEHPTRPKELSDDGEMKGVCGERTRVRTPEGIYETLYLPRAPLSPTTPPVRDDEYDEYSWGSSEFESYDEDEELPQDGAQEPISVTVEVKSRASQEPSNQNVLHKFAAKIGPRSWSRDEDEDSSTYLEVTLNMDKHPPPELPPVPQDLTPQQVKRRHIVASIVDSERSYTDSLRRIIEEYEKPLLMAKPQIISKNSIKVIFYRLRDILQCHNMFHIELAEYIRVWDTEEKLGNVFTASFSKSMVFDVYSEFVNNFTLAMETAKKLAKQKQTFADFLKLKIQNSPDKLSLFGLMVKPIQRFPQFILCLQDLLKHTCRDHHDRLALQLALTELETLTHKLNEMKRESENKHEVKKIQSAMTGRFSFKHDHNRCLVRQDDMIQMDCHTGSNKSKSRRLFLMNDQLVCTTVVQKDGETGLAEKFKFKWSIPIRDVEVVESEMPDLYQVQGGPGRSLIVAPKLDKSTVNPWKKELDDMMHDLAVIEQLTNLTSQLRLNYPGLNTDLLFGIQRSLQLTIQDQGDLDLCILHLSLPTNRGRHMLHTFQVQSASIKQDWLLDLKNAKLSLDHNNKPGWYVPETDHGHCVRLPLFVKPLLIDITKQDTKIQCAIPVVLPSYTNPYIGVQHLWVCSNESRNGQVTIVSLHSSQPHVLESFTACDSAIVCAEYVPGYSMGVDHEHAFPQDTVWMAMASKELCVRNVVEEERSEEPLLVMDTDGDLTCLRFMDSRLYAGLADGRLAIYNRDRDGVWQIEDRLLVDLGVSGVNALLPLNHHMWVACDNKVHVIHVTARWRAGCLQHDVKTVPHEVGSAEEEVLCMVKAGVGLMVSFRGRGVIRIYHQETFNHLQDVNVASAVTKVLEGKDLGDLKIQPRQIAITFMLASKGLLWIGTDCGCTLTLPLPRLEGVPQIKGRPSVSYHAHLGPIQFIVPIHCGPCQLHGPPTSPLSNQSQTGHSENDLDMQSENDKDVDNESDSDIPRNRPSMIVEGATESDTNCDESGGSEIQQQGADESEDLATSIMEGLSLQKGRAEYLSSSMLQLPQQETMGRTKWTSTPDLRHGSTINLNDSEEDVINLYNNLLQGAEYAHYDDELMGGKKRQRPQSGVHHYPLFGEGDHHIGHSGIIPPRTYRRGSKYNTLPVLIEDAPGRGMDITTLDIPQEEDSHEGSVERSFSTESGGDVSPGLPCMNDAQPELICDPPKSTSRPPSIHEGHLPLGPTPSTISRLNPSQKSMSKSVIIVTGGEGHINWAEKNAGDSKYDDICLLLWQCRV